MRTLSMAVKNCGGEVPRPSGDGEEGGGFDTEQAVLTTEDEELLKSARECLGAVRPLVGETQQLHKSLEAILQVRGSCKALREAAGGQGAGG